MSNKYSAMDSFCKVSTWHTPHPLDQRRFFEALLSIVDEPWFDPGEMAHYIRENHGDPMWPQPSAELDSVLQHLEDQAYAVWYSRDLSRITGG